MTPAAAAPRLSDQQLLDFSGLVGEADSVELKLTVPERAPALRVAALGLDPLDAQIRQVLLLRHARPRAERTGVVVRARRVQGKGDDSVVKLRPVVPAELPAEPAPVRRASCVEVDAMPGGFVCSGALKGAPAPGSASACAAGGRCASCSRRSSARSTPSTRPTGIALDDLPMLGPIFVLKLKCMPEGFGRRLVAELWLYPDGARILELSTKCAPAEAFQVAAETRAFLASRGCDLAGEQQTKTRKALEFFARQPE